MTSISSLTSIDPRSDWQKMSRRQCYRGAKNLDIPFKPNSTKDEMVTLLQAKGVTPAQVVNFVPVQVQTPDGSTKSVMYPEERERKYDETKEMRRDAVFEQRLAEGVEKDKADKERALKQAGEVQGLKADIAELREMFSQVLDSLTAKKPAKPKKEETLLNMHWKKFQKLAKEAGIEWGTKDPREPVIAKLEAKENVTDAVIGS